MTTARIVHTDTHAIVSSDDRAAVEAAVAELARTGATLVESIQKLGSKYIASCALPPRAGEREGPFVIEHAGTHTIVSGDNQHQLMIKLRELVAMEGYELISGPNVRERKWVCVLGPGGRTR
jgi:hypothetical protein